MASAASVTKVSFLISSFSFSTANAHVCFTFFFFFFTFSIHTPSHPSLFCSLRLSQAEERVGPPLHVDLEATLEDLYNGRTLTVTQKKQVLCHRCRGTGAENPDEVTKCPVCGGSGVRLITQQLGPGFITQTQTTYDLSLLLLPHTRLFLFFFSRIALHCIANSAAAPAQL